MTPAERAAAGKAARARVPRSSHGIWEPPANRDPVSVLLEQAKTRVPELVPIRHGRMLAGTFAFYRGAAAVMAADLGASQPCGLTAQICGDAHLSNFGLFASPDRTLVFSVNDFDETLPGPFEWDVKRLAASIEIAGRERAFAKAERRATVLAALAEYRLTMHRFAEMRDLDVWYTRLDVGRISKRWRDEASRAQRRAFEANIAKAQHKDSLRALAKLTRVVGGERRIVSDPPLIVPIDELDSGVGALDPEDLLAEYRKSLEHDRRRLAAGYRYVHSARKVVGVGSVGTRAWIVLLVGRDRDDPLFLQLKQAEESVLEPFAGRSRFSSRGRRVVEGQRLMQAASDILLGWFTAEDGRQRVDFYVRQLWDWKRSVELEALAPRPMAIYAEMCGWTLARAHARSGDRVAIAAYLGNGDRFDRAIADFAAAYADQNQRDYEAMQAAEAEGRITAEHGL